MPLSLIHITVAYSNAVLVAILPHVSDFAKKLNLPIQIPITASQIAHFNVGRIDGDAGGELRLTNDYSFGFAHGYVGAFRALTNNPFYGTGDEDIVQMLRPYVGKSNMTTNEAIELARNAFYKLGYKSEDFDINGFPTRIDGPMNSKKIGHIPYCQIEWDSPDSKIQHLLGSDFNIEFEIDMQRKQVVGMNLSGRKFWQPEIKTGVVPELESDYEMRVNGWTAIMRGPPAIHLTPAYSNATLTATLSYVSEFAKKLRLPVAQPLTNNQVLLFIPPAYTNDGFKSIVMLTNRYWFLFFAGFVTEFSSPDDWFEESQTKTNWTGFDQNCMTTNEAIAFARNSFRQLGYKPEDFHVNELPAFETAMDNQNRHYAYCRVDWENPEIEEQGTEEKQPDIYQIQFDIDTLRKQVVGVTLIGKKFMQPLPKIDVQPQLETDYRKPASFKMFVRTNAPLIIRK
jgi:hypothetical protein